MKAIVNTSPLLFLSKIHRLSILEKLDQIFVPTGVITEIKQKQDDALDTVIKASDSWLKFALDFIKIR